MHSRQKVCENSRSAGGWTWTMDMDNGHVPWTTLSGGTQVPKSTERCEETLGYSELSQDSWVTAIWRPSRQEILSPVIWVIPQGWGKSQRKRGGCKNACGGASGISAMVERVLRSGWGNSLKCRFLCCII